jgi:two-component system, OmpR family, alkaline phosphatase synthesis response regulator PhoP
MKQAVLIVDDDKEIVRVLRSYLEQAQFTVHFAYDGLTALAILKRERPPMLVLDLMLPDRDGLEITRMIRADSHLAKTYVIMLTARVEDLDRIVGLEIGADDYVTKPFNPREVVARVRSGFRRKELEADHAADQIFAYEDLVLDQLKHTVSVKGELVDLTPTEYSLLARLMSRQGVPFSRDDLLQNRADSGGESLERTLDSHIRNLRKKIESDPANPKYIQTVYGLGYRLGEP